MKFVAPASPYFILTLVRILLDTSRWIEVDRVVCIQARNVFVIFLIDFGATVVEPERLNRYELDYRRLVFVIL